MTVDWGVVSIIATIVAAWSGVLVAIIKWLLKNHFQGIEKRFNDLDEGIKKHAGDVHRIDVDIANLRTEMHADFWRRQDAIRQDVVVGAKLDALAAKIENLTLRIGTNGP